MEHANTFKIFKENNKYYSHIVSPCLVKNHRSSESLSFSIFYITLTPFCHFSIFPFCQFTIAPLYHFIHFAYYLIRNYSGKMYKLIQKYQGSEEALLCQFGKSELIKGGEVFKVYSWAMRNFPSFKICQDHSNEVEWEGLAQNKNNLMLSIFGRFGLILWWEARKYQVPLHTHLKKKYIIPKSLKSCQVI